MYWHRFWKLFLYVFGRFLFQWLKPVFGLTIYIYSYLLLLLFLPFFNPTVHVSVAFALKLLKFLTLL